MSISHFLSLDDLPAEQLTAIIDRGIELKKMLADGVSHTPLTNQTLAMIFSKASTRTRVSFEVGMRQLGGGALNLSPGDTQIGRGEPIEDTARVLSSMANGIMVRTDAHEKVELFAEYSRVPVINGLTDDVHPCQLLADLMTVKECQGGFQDCVVAWVGDGNNVCHSWMNAARIFGFELRIATPENYRPTEKFRQKNAAAVTIVSSPDDAVKHADVVVTDTWASMGQEQEKQAREAAFADYCVDDRLMALAAKHAIFMHCLPAYRGMEVSESVFEGNQSVVFQEAENRLHAQKALLEALLS